MIKNTLLTALFVGVLMCTFGVSDAFAGSNGQSSQKVYGISFESKATAPAIIPGMITGADFEVVYTTADEMIKVNNFNQAYAYLKPYEVNIFGTVNHWGNMARYDWLMAQIFEKKNDPTNAVRYLNYIIDDSAQTTPTKNLEQYVSSGTAPNFIYYFGAAKNPFRPTDIFNKAKDKKDAIYSYANRASWGKPDPRMKYENCPRRRITSY